MTKKLAFTVTIISLCYIAAATYLFPFVETFYASTGTQKFLMMLVLAAFAGITSAAAVEYIVNLPLNSFLDHLKRNWGKKEALTEGMDSLDPERSAILKTVTEMVAAQSARIEELERITGDSAPRRRLFTTLSHQLRTPFTGLKWALSIIEQNLARGEKVDPVLITGAVEAVTRIGILTEDLLAGLDEQTKPDTSFKTTDIEQCLDQILKESSLLAAQRDMRISIVKGVTRIPLVRGSEREIGFVLHCLITNALHYGDKDSAVTVTITHTNDMVAIGIHNLGKTIPENERASLFSKFSRGEEAIRLNPDGTGLALYLAHQIIIDYGGAISFSSDQKNGTTFSVTLPISNRGQLETSIDY